METRPRRDRRLFVAGVPIAAWLVGAAPAAISGASWPHGGRGPTLPLVSLPFDPRRDFVSSVPSLFAVLLLAVGCAVIIELSKGALLAYGAQRPYGSFILLFAFQILLALDLFRAYAKDWWTWGLSELGLVTLQEGAPLATIAGRTWPWPSLLALAVVTGVLVRPGKPSTPA